MPRDRKPGTIREASTDYRTEALRDAGKELLEKWDEDMTFQQMAADGEWSARHYSNAFYENMGPTDDEQGRTFEQIKEQYGTLTKYYEKRDIVEQSVEESTPMMAASMVPDGFTEEQIEAFQEGFKFAVELMEQGVIAPGSKTANKN